MGPVQPSLAPLSLVAAFAVDSVHARDNDSGGGGGLRERVDI
jgi:hypothetical protein